MSLAKTDQDHIWHPYTQMQDADHICIVKGEGSYLFDETGKKYLDVVSSWWTNLHGHSHPYIVEKISQQAKQLEHVIFAGFTHPPAIQLAGRLLQHLPSSHQKIFFSDNGSTAVEVALKMAIQYWKNLGEKRTKIIAFKNAYHGDTFGSMSASERGIFTGPFHDLLFEADFISAPEKGNKEHSINELKSKIKNQKSKIATFIFEPLVQGAAGMRMHDAETLSELIRICRQHNIITIADEVMTGFGRTGRFFATDYLDEKPDIICLSKGITGGFMPLAITSCTQKIFEAFLSEKNSAISKTFYHGHSYTANPLGCAAALASLDLMELEETWQNIHRIEKQHASFKEKISAHPGIKEVRHRGTILAIELNTEDAAYTSAVRDEIYSFFMMRGILMRPLGNVMYLMPPYCISEEELDFVYASMMEFLELEK